MIDKSIAARQLERLSGLNFFPKEAPAKKELLLAMQVALTEDIAAQVVSDWLAESGECPKPADLRRNINARQEGLLEQRRRCHFWRPTTACPGGNCAAYSASLGSRSLLG